ncbi:hypothetical protein CYMTET_16604 [Cymbomonas tetramitiformis]|uniref:Uncharacterized protein n=1 Tax=Cymbomonas tetramitiformis TaxID=36881 RepID=A0AAE0GBV1_9CHLO|nr:hypothetical protein CYMTET_16604 [Cymbomonas tetramitiformis]
MSTTVILFTASLLLAGGILMVYFAVDGNLDYSSDDYCFTTDCDNTQDTCWRTTKGRECSTSYRGLFWSGFACLALSLNGFAAPYNRDAQRALRKVRQTKTWSTGLVVAALACVICWLLCFFFVWYAEEGDYEFDADRICRDSSCVECDSTVDVCDIDWASCDSVTSGRRCSDTWIALLVVAVVCPGLGTALFTLAATIEGDKDDPEYGPTFTGPPPQTDSTAWDAEKARRTSGSLVPEQVARARSVGPSPLATRLPSGRPEGSVKGAGAIPRLRSGMEQFQIDSHLTQSLLQDRGGLDKLVDPDTGDIIGWVTRKLPPIGAADVIAQSLPQPVGPLPPLQWQSASSYDNWRRQLEEYQQFHAEARAALLQRPPLEEAVQEPHDPPMLQQYDPSNPLRVSPSRREALGAEEELRRAKLSMERQEKSELAARELLAAATQDEVTAPTAVDAGRVEDAAMAASMGMQAAEQEAREQEAREQQEEERRLKEARDASERLRLQEEAEWDRRGRAAVRIQRSERSRQARKREKHVRNNQDSQRREQAALVIQRSERKRQTRKRDKLHDDRTGSSGGGGFGLEAEMESGFDERNAASVADPQGGAASFFTLRPMYGELQPEDDQIVLHNL